MKKILCVIALLLVCVCIFTACKNNEGNNPQETSTTIDSTTPDTSVNQENYVPTEGIIYEVAEDGTYAVVVGYEGTATEVKIAKTYNELPVTIIDSEAFYSCTSLTSVTIPDSVTTIGVGAFCECTSLTSIAIPDSVATIGMAAFGRCSSLMSVTIGEAVTSFGDGVFAGCSSLLNIVVDNDNTAYQSIDGNLYSKDGKTLITYAIGKSDTSFTIPDSVTSIGMGAFLDSTLLTSVTIGDGVESIGDSAFDRCSSLTSVVIPDSVTSIGDSAFQSCASLTSVTIGDGVTSIGSQAFFDCDALTSVTIGDSVTSIGSHAFRECASLTSVAIGDSVTIIDHSAFDSCLALTSVTFNGTVEQWDAIEKEFTWNSATGTYIIYCTDGEITKDGRVTYY